MVWVFFLWWTGEEKHAQANKIVLRFIITENVVVACVRALRFNAGKRLLVSLHRVRLPFPTLTSHRAAICEAESDVLSC